MDRRASLITEHMLRVREVAGSAGHKAGCGVRTFRRLTLISIDLLLMASATIVAVMLRGNFDTVSNSLIILMPYVFISIGCASRCFSHGRAGSNALAIQFSCGPLASYRLIRAGYPASSCSYLCLNRLEPVARSLPVLQGALIISILVFARSAARFWYARQIHINGNGRANGTTARDGSRSGREYNNRIVSTIREGVCFPTSSGGWNSR